MTLVIPHSSETSIEHHPDVYAEELLHLLTFNRVLNVEKEARDVVLIFDSHTYNYLLPYIDIRMILINVLILLSGTNVFTANTTKALVSIWSCYSLWGLEIVHLDYLNPRKKCRDGLEFWKSNSYNLRLGCKDNSKDQSMCCQLLRTWLKRAFNKYSCH